MGAGQRPVPGRCRLMALRFFRRIRIAPGLTVNLSKSGASLSIGPRGAKYTVGPRGTRATLGLPGTGLFYTVHNPHKPRKSAPAHKSTPAGRSAPAAAHLPRPIPTSSSEGAFLAGIEALAHDEVAARAQFARGADLADAAWMAGLLGLGQGDLAAARDHLERALADAGQLGALMAKFALAPQIDLPITPQVTAHIQPGEAGTRLALVEIAQQQGDAARAMAQLEHLLALVPDDPVVVLSFAELALDRPADRALMDRVIELTAAATNETAIDTAILLYRGRALAALGLDQAAIHVLTQANRRHKDRPPALMQQIRHDRAALYAKTGRKAQARREFERLYAETPDFPGLRDRLAAEG